MSTLYHYTSLLHLTYIVEAGALRATGDANLSPEGFTGPVLWLTTLDDVSEGMGLENPQVNKYEVRFTVRVDGAQLWLETARKLRVPQWWVEALVRSGGGMDHARTWRFIQRDIPRKDWLAVDVRLAPDRPWVPYPLNVLSTTFPEKSG